ncbi:MAG: RidA family protein [Chloroflexi bacterium]|nr:RidA family protein [Chloroflexota bacterium]
MFQQVRRAGGLLFVIGMVGRTPEGPVIEGGIRAQTKRALERIEEVLQGEGRTRADIVRARFFVTDMRLWPEARDEANIFFSDQIPPATAVGVTQLVEPGMLIEIEVEASAA